MGGRSAAAALPPAPPPAAAAARRRFDCLRRCRLHARLMLLLPPALPPPATTQHRIGVQQLLGGYQGNERATQGAAQLMPCPCTLRPRPGPRRRNEGVDDEDQGIVAAESTPSGATVTVSLLAAGFVVGPGGASVRAICAATSADIRSYTESQSGRRVRVFVLEVGAGRWHGWLVWRRWTRGRLWEGGHMRVQGVPGCAV